MSAGWVIFLFIMVVAIRSDARRELEQKLEGANQSKEVEPTVVTEKEIIPILFMLPLLIVSWSIYSFYPFKQKFDHFDAFGCPQPLLEDLDNFFNVGWSFFFGSIISFIIYFVVGCFCAKERKIESGKSSKPSKEIYTKNER